LRSEDKNAAGSCNDSREGTETPRDAVPNAHAPRYRLLPTLEHRCAQISRSTERRLRPKLTPQGSGRFVATHPPSLVAKSDVIDFSTFAFIGSVLWNPSPRVKDGVA
jgi:hypothetical protein